MKKKSLKLKIAIVLFLSFFLAVLIISASVYLYTSKNLQDSKIAETSSLSVALKQKSDLEIEINQKSLRVLSGESIISKYLLSHKLNDEDSVLDIFNSFKKQDDKYLAIYLLDKNGIGLVSTDERFVGQNYSFRDYFKNSILGKSFFDLAVGKTSNQFGYYYSEPILDNKNEILGVVVLKVDQSSFDNLINYSEVGKNNNVMLVDEFGVVVSTNNPEFRMKSLGVLSNQEKLSVFQSERFIGQEITPLQYDLAQDFIRNYQKEITLKINDKKDNENEYLYLIKLDNAPLYLLTEIRMTSVKNHVFNIILIQLLIMIIILTLLLICIYFIVSTFLRPLNLFKDFFVKIGKGDFSSEVKIKSNDEFSDIANSVNKMAKDLFDLYNNLDEKVKNQTDIINKKIIESENQNKAILNILEDVESEKNKVQNIALDLEKFKLAVENASDQIVITDKNGIVIYGNRAVKNITGYDQSEALGKKVGVLWKSPMSKEYYDKLWDTLLNKKKTFISEIQNKRKNGEIYTAIISISIVLDNKGEIIYFVAIERDITKEKEVDKAKTEFVSLASHQLRTPLSAINWYTEMLLAGDAGAINEEQQKYLKEIAFGNKRMVDLVDDLLNVSRLDTGTFVFELKNINVQELVKSVLSENKTQIIEKKLTVNEFYGPDIPAEFIADEKLIRMVFQNLLSNAVKYTPLSGSVNFSLTKINKDEIFGSLKTEEESLAFMVSDTGMGIPSNQQEKIFSKLFRADNAKESETEGTGLGLYVIKSIIDLSGGKIWFNSEEEKGTTFYVVFPISGMKTKIHLKN